MEIVELKIIVSEMKNSLEAVNSQFVGVDEKPANLKIDQKII